jgi:hypothetical protein
MTICYLLIATNLLKCHSILGHIAKNLTNRRSVLAFNIHQCTSVTKNQNTSQNCDELNKSSQCLGLQYPSVHIRDEKTKYVVDAVLFVMFSENVTESSSQIK